MDVKMQILQGLQFKLCKYMENEEVARVCRILAEILDNFSISETNKNEIKTDLLLTNFIQAKKLEGCSEKTLIYYKSTLDKLFKFSNKPASEIVSEDIRTYLSHIQTSRQISKITIDNNRRIFSTFFS